MDAHEPPSTGLDEPSVFLDASSRPLFSVSVGHAVRAYHPHTDRSAGVRDHVEASLDGVGALVVIDDGCRPVLQSFEREADTAENFLDAFLGYRRSLIELQQATYFDFEAGLPLPERYELSGPTLRQ